MIAVRRFLAVVLVASLAPFVEPASAQNLVTWSNAVGVPLPDAIAPKPIVLKLQVKDPANAGQVKIEEVSVAVARWPAVVGETALQASKRKAEAIAAAINAKLPGQASSAPITKRVIQFVPHPVTRQPVPMWVEVPTQWALQIKDLAEHPAKPKDNPIIRVDDGTNQPGGGGAIQRQPGGGGGGSPGSMPYKGSMGGKTSLSSGVGSYTTPAETIPSAIGFGYYTTTDEMGDAIPLTIATVYPQAGQSESAILMTLASQLNAAGVGADFDSATNTLSLRNPLNSENQTLFWSNLDTGLQVTMAISSIPEPASALLAIAALGGLMVARRRKRNR
jgi:hypothetical protein